MSDNSSNKTLTIILGLLALLGITYFINDQFFSNVNNLNCTACENPIFKTLTEAEFEKYKKNYADYNLPLLNTSYGVKDSTGDAQAVWFSMDELENYICYVKRLATEANYPTVGMGINISYIKYDSVADASISGKHSVAISATYSANGTRAILRNVGADSKVYPIMNHGNMCPPICQ